MAQPNFFPVDGNRTVNLILAGTVTAGNMVKANGTEAGDGETAFGIAMSSGVSGDTIAVWRGPGRLKCTAAAGVDFAIGDQVYMAASQKVDAGAAANKSIGIVVDTNPATAGTVYVDFDPFGTFAHA